MRSRVLLYILLLLITGKPCATAQRVSYSPFIDDPFEVIGKSGNYYWLESKENRKIGKKQEAEVQSFSIYDSRLNEVNFIPPSIIPASMLKEYFVGSEDYLDQVMVLSGNALTSLVLNRYSSDGNLLDEGKTLLNLPFNEGGNSIIMARSADRSKNLVLCFEGNARIHAAIYDQNWELISYKIYKHPLFSQPFIQDDFTDYPVESFNNSPIKLANNGQWLMTAPSRTSNNFVLFHFGGIDTGFTCREIRLPEASTWEDVALSFDDEKQEAYAGILSVFKYQSLKDVEVVHYSLARRAFDFDSSYRFNTLMAYRILNENLVHESFISLHGNGFMLLKEYGQPYDEAYDDNRYIDPGGLLSVFADNSISNTIAPQLINRDGYTRYDRLGGPLGLYNRGDLSLFYFPAHNKDSCWSGIIDKEQVTEFNTPYLSYLVLPVNQRIFLLYNSFIRNEEQFGSTTILDYKGNLMTDQGMMYWELKNTLDFPHARQIGEDEVAIPYDNFKRKGFAIIKF